MTTLSETAAQTATATAARPEGPESVASVRMRAYARVRVQAAVAVWRRLYAVAVGDDRSAWPFPPDTPKALRRYAALGAWCSPTSRVWRTAGRAYAVGVAIPVTVALNVAVLIAQRPGRLAVALFLFLIFRLSL
jgi:hypothetical protein